MKYNDIPLIGITERGDASKDLSWTISISNVAGAILITKNIDDSIFRGVVLTHLRDRHKIIIHATITGMGGSFVEPFVKPPKETIEALINFCNYFPPEQIVLRVDPVIPTKKGQDNAKYVIETVLNGTKGAINRIRFSFIDNYKHLLQRGLELPWKSFHPPEELQYQFIEYLKLYEKQNIIIASCGENSKLIPINWKVGCVDLLDYTRLNIELPKDFIIQRVMCDKSVLKKQRDSCECLRTKTELLNHRKKCSNGCLYCYWKQ